jgi:hypothetical protein
MGWMTRAQFLEGAGIFLFTMKCRLNWSSYLMVIGDKAARAWS